MSANTLSTAELKTDHSDFTRDVALTGVTRVLIGGFDNAGKSTLTCSLYRALNQQGIRTALYELDRWSDTHDPILGIKSWQERQKRAQVSPAEYAAYAQYFAADQSTIVLGDIEGRYQNPHPRCLKRTADFGILVVRDAIAKDQTTAWPQTTAGWEGLFTDIEVPILARVKSVRGDAITDNGYLTVNNLDRELIPHHPAIQKLASVVLQLAGALQASQL